MTWYGHDHIGSTRLLTDDTGVEVGAYRYEAYGLQLDHTGTTTTPLRFTGEYTDDESGYQYLRARYYHPQTGNFLTRDPLADLTREPYGYTSGNPLNRVDPAGLRWGPIPTSWDELKEDIGRVVDIGARAGSGVAQSTPPGAALQFWSMVTGHSVGVCAGGNGYRFVEAGATFCYIATPTGRSGYTVSTSWGAGGPRFGLTGLLGPTVSNARCASELGGRSSRAWGSAGFAQYGASGEYAWWDGNGRQYWQTTAGWAPHLGPMPVGFGGGGAQTWTVGF